MIGSAPVIIPGFLIGRKATISHVITSSLRTERAQCMLLLLLRCMLLLVLSSLLPLLLYALVK